MSDTQKPGMLLFFSFFFFFSLQSLEEEEEEGGGEKETACSMHEAREPQLRRRRGSQQLLHSAVPWRSSRCTLAAFAWHRLSKVRLKFCEFSVLHQFISELNLQHA